MPTESTPIAPAHIAEAIVLPDGYTRIEEVVLPACRWLRENMPVALAHVEGYDPVWLITKHAHIREVLRNGERFHNADVNIMLHPRAGDDYLRGLLKGTTKVLDNLSYMEAPEHTRYRMATAFSFLPAQVRKFEPRFREIARQAVDKLLQHDGDCDFVDALARDYPLNAVLEMLGIPPSDYPYMLKLTQDTFGGDDPDWVREDVDLADPEAAAKQWLLAVEEAYEYFEVLRKDRHANPRDDLATAIVTAKVDTGESIPDRIQNHLTASIALAGHDTTNSAISGGVLGLARHPEQLAKVKRDPTLVPALVDECLRYSTPAKHFMRNATVDTEFQGISMRSMDRLMCLFVSGNRDEEVFADPDRFVADRRPNPHLSFSWGPHTCLGQHIAKIEMRALFDELIPRIASIELAGEPKLKRGNFVTGPKTLPVRIKRA